MEDDKMIKEQVVQVLMDIYDPEIPVNIFELGLIYDIVVDDQDNVVIVMTLTTPNCPVADSLPLEIQERVQKEVEEAKSVKVELTFNPPWTKERMTQAAKLALGID